MTRLAMLFALCAAGFAQASGFYLGDNGARAMVQGGAFAAQADDATAMQHNPAGLTQSQGFSFLADLQVLRHDVSYLRQDPGFDETNPSTLINTVHNRPDPFLLPFFAATYGLPVAGRTLTIGLGLFAPPSQGKYEYPVPNYQKDDAGKYVERPNRFSPQRYALISNNIVIAYPTLSVAYEIHPRFQVGISAQLTLSNFAQSQIMYGGDALNDNPQRQLLENPDYDATVSIDLPGQIGFTGILGVMWRPTDWLRIGGSVRPPIPFKARGKITVELPPFFKGAGATVAGDTATLQMTLPMEIKLGARILPLPGPYKDLLGLNVDLVYQGWQSIDQLLLTPENVTLSSGPGAEARPIPAFALKKNWMPSFSVRVGTSFRVHHFLSLHLGTMFETGAAPTATYSVDWTHPTRFIFTGGVTGHFGPFDLIAGALFTPTITTVVNDSIVARGQTNPEIEPGKVGNGIYTSGAWGLIFGVRGHFGDPKPSPRMDVLPRPPVAAPMPANPEQLPVTPTQS